MQMKQILLRGLAIVLALVLSVMMLAVVVYDMGTAPQLMLKLMQRYAPAGKTGLPAQEYPAMAEMITSYLHGITEEFQYTYTENGTEFLAFHDYEQEHMQDVRQLFALCQRVMWGCAFLMPWLWCALGLQRDWRNFRWLQMGLLGVLLLVTAVAVLAAVDFNSLFILFHEMAFTNELWLLNPRTDMLIRLMPTEFFVAYATAIAAMWLVLVLCLLLIAEVIRRKFKPKKGSDVP